MFQQTTGTTSRSVEERSVSSNRCREALPDQLSVFNEQDRIRSIQSLQEEMHTQLANENVIVYIYINCDLHAMK